MSDPDRQDTDLDLDLDQRLEIVLTAYADDALEAADRDRLAALIARQPALQARVEGLRELQATLRRSLKALPVPTRLGADARLRLRRNIRQERSLMRRRGPWLRVVLMAAAALVITLLLPNLYTRTTASASASWSRPGTAGAPKAHSLNDTTQQWRIDLDWLDPRTWGGQARAEADNPPVTVVWKDKSSLATTRHDGLSSSVDWDYAAPPAPKPVVSTLDLKPDECFAEDPEPKPKGREEAVATSERGGQGAFVTMGKAGEHVENAPPKVARADDNGRSSSIFYERIELDESSVKFTELEKASRVYQATLKAKPGKLGIGGGEKKAEADERAPSPVKPSIPATEVTKTREERKSEVRTPDQDARLAFRNIASDRGVADPGKTLGGNDGSPKHDGLTAGGEFQGRRIRKEGSTDNRSDAYANDKSGNDDRKSGVVVFGGVAVAKAELIQPHFDNEEVITPIPVYANPGPMIGGLTQFPGPSLMIPPPNDSAWNQKEEKTKDNWSKEHKLLSEAIPDSLIVAGQQDGLPVEIAPGKWKDADGSLRTESNPPVVAFFSANAGRPRDVATGGARNLYSYRFSCNSARGGAAGELQAAQIIDPVDPDACLLVRHAGTANRLTSSPQPGPAVNPWTLTAKDALSTFALDVDTASYAKTLAAFKQGFLPVAAQVRIEEFVNAFDYNYPTASANTFNVHAEAGPSPFGEGLTLLQVGVKGKVLGRDQRKPAHLVFVIDTSGSMQRADRLPVLRRALGELAANGLGPDDRVSLVGFGHTPRLVLDRVAAPALIPALRDLQTGGATNLVEGLRLGYRVAAQGFIGNGVNRVVLCSDGVANLGATEADEILAQVESFRRQGIGCTTVAVGAGQANDALLERLANRGDGSCLFVEDAPESRAALRRAFAAENLAIAKDAKIQVTFDPQRVRRYRLIGYENRAIADADFLNDAIDAGEVGSGQSSTALYEVELLPDASRDLGSVSVRWHDLGGRKVQEIAYRLRRDLPRATGIAERPRFHLAACAAEFAEQLRGSPHAAGGSLDQIRAVLSATAAVLPLDPQVAAFREMVDGAAGLPRRQ